MVFFRDKMSKQKEKVLENDPDTNRRGPGTPDDM
jgi:hypothetical protein